MKQTISFFLLLSVGLSIIAGEKALLYISGPVAMAEQLEKAFEAKHGDVLDVFRTESGPLQQKLWAELFSGEISADMVWGAETSLYQALMEKGILESYVPEGYEQLKEGFQYSEGFFVPVNARYVVIVYHKNLVDPAIAPKDWADLANPAFNGRIGIADPLQSAMAFALLAGLTQQEEGAKLLEASVRITRLCTIRIRRL